MKRPGFRHLIARLFGKPRCAHGPILFMGTRQPRRPRYAYGSATEAALAVCARMHSRVLKRRIARASWAAARRGAALRILTHRGDLCHES